MKITIIDYGAGNIQSIKFALLRLGYEAILTQDPEDIFKADKVIFPGVGEASSAMHKLNEANMVSLIPTLRQPVLGICLGMQLLCKSSVEGNTKGIGVFDVDIRRFTSEVKVPQVGWNTVYNLQSPLFKGIEEGSFMYGVHSYYAPLCTETVSETYYGMAYTSGLEKDNFFGVQFHPEKSSKMGSKLLNNFLKL